ncbi:MAG: DUF4331 domain-containing protein [Blastocatellia bacterium]|nr:DUF4331 domain-containing protein [Blastocatellia bacterium]
MQSLNRFTRSLLILSLLFSTSAIPALASSHAEAPLISMDPYADNTDVYAFRSTESGREGFVTIISNFIPFQDPSGGPQYFRFDDSVLYEIKIDNTGDGRPNVTYQFQFETHIVNSETILGHTAVNVDGQVTTLDDPDYNMPQTYTVRRVEHRNDRGRGRGNRSTVIASGIRTPPSNVGPRVTPNYEENLGSRAVYPLTGGGRVFAGQRDESFFIDLGGVFDGLNLRTVQATGGIDTLRTYNVNSIAIEVPIGHVTRSGAIPTSTTAADAVVGIWSTASRQKVTVLNPDPKARGPFTQVSRLGNPLVNELIVPLGLKDAFNASEPTQDAALVPAVLDPELPKLIKLVANLYGIGELEAGTDIQIPPAPRTDLALIFALGIPTNTVPGAPSFTTVIAGSNGPHEYLRLNLAYTPAGENRLGLLGGDLTGFPNGRRVFDDVVDIELRAVLGGTPFTPDFNIAPNNTIGDGVSMNEQPFLTRFPYLAPPNPGNTVRPTNFPAH